VTPLTHNTAGDPLLAPKGFWDGCGVGRPLGQKRPQRWIKPITQDRPMEKKKTWRSTFYREKKNRPCIHASNEKHLINPPDLPCHPGHAGRGHDNTGRRVCLNVVGNINLTHRTCCELSSLDARATDDISI